jgi:hypothetical protein
MCITCVGIFPTNSLSAFHFLFQITVIISPNIINQLIFVTEMWCVILKIRTEVLYIINIVPKFLSGRPPRDD